MPAPSDNPLPTPDGKKPSPAMPSANGEVPSTVDVPVDQLTPEQQMERFAKELKENDWGHQPC